MIDRHGLDTPPYEEYDACPACLRWTFAEAFPCELCGEIITGDYISLRSGERYCDACYTLSAVGE